MAEIRQVRPSATELIQLLDQELRARFESEYGPISISPLRETATVADATILLLISDSTGSPRAVALCASPAVPEGVQRAMSRAQSSQQALTPELKETIISPLAEGVVNGLSWAVLPYCAPLSDSALIWRVQRALLRAPIFGWLFAVMQCTAREASPAEIEQRFLVPLQSVQRMPFAPDVMLAASKTAIARLERGEWKPRTVLMHCDLWKGNILIRRRMAGESIRWRDRFVVIDWGGSVSAGYAMYDLMRIGQSLQISTAYLRSQVLRHCGVLRCETADARGYLAAALAHIGANLGHFPADRFINTVEECFAVLEAAL